MERALYQISIIIISSSSSSSIFNVYINRCAFTVQACWSAMATIVLTNATTFSVSTGNVMFLDQDLAHEITNTPIDMNISYVYYQQNLETNKTLHNY